MSILRIRTIGDPVLRTPAQEVTQFDDALAALVRDMLETMYAVGGVGLAAPQVGVGLRVFTWGIDGDEGHVINPQLSMGEEPQEGGEGCLSVPGLSYETPRAEHAVLTGVDCHGEPVHREATGLLARCFQHENDHLGGMLYVDRLVGDERKDAMRQLRAQSFTDTTARVTREREAQRASHSTPDAHDAAGSAFGAARTSGAASGKARSASGAAHTAGSAFGAAGDAR